MKKSSSFHVVTFCSTHSNSDWQLSRVITSNRSDRSTVGIVGVTRRRRAAEKKQEENVGEGFERI
jgi:hypothetical protein